MITLMGIITISLPGGWCLRRPLVVLPLAGILCRIGRHVTE